VRQYEKDTILCVANLSRSAQAAEIDLAAWKGRVPLELLGRKAFPRIGGQPYVVTLAPYGFFWFLLCDQPGPAAESPNLHREFTTLVWTAGWDSLLRGRERYALEHEVLPGFLLERRWFGEKGRGLPTTKLQYIIPLERGELSAALAFVDIGDDKQDATRYLLPLIIKWTRFDRAQAPSPNVVAAIRRGPREGTLLDAATDQELIGASLQAIYAGDTFDQGERRLECRPTSAFRDMAPPLVEKIAVPNREQSNTTVIADSAYVLKLFRKVNDGIHPEIEIGRFLIEQTGYRNAPDLLGSIELVEDGRRSALVVVHRFIENQGDAWTVTSAFLDRFIDDQRVLSAANPEDNPELVSYLQRLRQIALRTGELQSALASRPDVPDFAPEPITAQDIAAWTDRLVKRGNRTLDLLAQKRDTLSETDQAKCERILSSRAAAVEHIRHALPVEINAVKVRHHGDFHLGQVLVVKDDAFILDFEGEPGRSLAERRGKVPAARDVAGLIRSIDYSTTAALFNATDLTPEERAILTPKLGIWRDKAMEVFWDACRPASDPGLWPADAVEARNLLDFFLLEKALYEIEYELMNRPLWLHVPLDGTWRILLRHNVVQL
jgi:maltose alpha-D-glucosyltransferase/alpha-amylase